MTWTRGLAALAVVGLLMGFAGGRYRLPPAPRRNYLVQISTANPTIVTADVSMKSKRVVDFAGVGLGALAEGGGEFVLFDGAGWTTDTEGNVSKLKGSTALGYFGIMSGYEPSGSALVDEDLDCLDLAGTSDGTLLDDYLNALLGDDDSERMATFRIHGTFQSISYVYADPLNPSPMTIENVEATIIGTKSGSYVTGDSITVDGIAFGLSEHPFHTHFVTDDRSIVGHVVDCSIQAGDATIEWALADTYDVRIPFSGDVVAAKRKRRRKTTWWRW